jgi:membrane protease YdiL (CAAX protease family)
MTPVTRQTFRPEMAAIIFCVVMLVTLLLSVIFQAALPVPANQWCYAFVAPFLYIVAVLLGGRLDGVDVPYALGLKRAPRPWQAGIAVGLSVACVVAFLPLAMGVKALFALMGYHATPTYADYSSGWGNLILGLVGLALLPAIGEEFMCRGMMFGVFKQKGTYFGIIASALLFALWHGSPVQLVHQLLIGVVMALLVHFTHTVWTSVIFHFCNNALVIVYEFVYKQAGWTYTIEWWVLLIMFAVGLPVVVALVYLLGRTSVKRAEREAVNLTFVGEHPTLAMRVRRTLDVDGEYVPYVKGKSMIAVYLTFALVGVIWLLNTISGWVSA